MVSCMTLEHLNGMPGVHVVNRKISISKLADYGACKYYQRIKWSLSGRLKEGKDVYINFILEEPISEKWLLETVLSLQMEHTRNIIIPSNNLDLSEIREWISFFQPDKVILPQITQ